MDKIKKKTRSQVMAAIRSKNTKPEVLLRKALFASGFRFRIHVKNLPSAPDIVLPKYNSIILVHGCFWHGHFCKISRIPKSNIKFWGNKIYGNQARDLKTKAALKKLGWKVLIVWECTLNKKNFSKTFTKILKWLES